MLTATFRERNHASGLKRHHAPAVEEQAHTQVITHAPARRFVESYAIETIRGLETIEDVKAYIFDGIKSGAKMGSLYTGGAIYTALSERFAAVRDQHRNRRGEIYTRDDGDEFTPTAARFLALWKLEQETDISVELDGAFVWVSGDTKPIKDKLKALGMRFSGPRQAWYYTDKKRYS